MLAVWSGEYTYNRVAEEKDDQETDIKKFGTLFLLLVSHYSSFLVLDLLDILSPSPPDPGGCFTHADSQTPKSARWQLSPALSGPKEREENLCSGPEERGEDIYDHVLCLASLSWDSIAKHHSSGWPTGYCVVIDPDEVVRL